MCLGSSVGTHGSSIGWKRLGLQVNQPDSPLEKDGEPFKNGREFAAWLGMVPRQHTTGGKPLVLGISQRGERYLRQWHIPRTGSRPDSGGQQDGLSMLLMEVYCTPGPDSICRQVYRPITAQRVSPILPSSHS